MTHLEEINEIWYAYEHNKVEVGELIQDALDLQQRTTNEEVLESIHHLLIACGWIR